MARVRILSQPRWQGFLDRPGLDQLSTPVLQAADDFFGFVVTHNLADPAAADIARWAELRQSPSSPAPLDQLALAMAICVPAFGTRIEEARQLRARAPARKQASPITGSPPAGKPSRRRAAWDPIAPPSRKPPRARAVSVEPSELPAEMQEALRQMATGRPRNGVSVAPAILKRMREKLCQFARSAEQAGLPPELSDQAIERYVLDLIARGEKGRNGIRWATIRASIEELHRYARYTGAPAETVAGLASRFAQMEGRERRQKALKFFDLACTGNTTLGVLDEADRLLERAVAEDCPRRRHRLRNGACILGLYPVAPLRPASADLVFGESLFWREHSWVIEASIQKTQSRNPELFRMRLIPAHGMFIDAVLLGDHHPRYLPELRAEALEVQRQLFTLADGSPTAATYIPRLYKELTGNSFGTTRTMLHTDQATAHGLAGTRAAALACHHRGENTICKYQAEAVAIMALERRQAAASARRARYQDRKSVV